MDRRKSLKAIAIGTITTGVLVDACKPGTENNNNSTTNTSATESDFNRMPEEKEYEESLKNTKDFFTAEEIATITIIADIIIPKDEVSGSASDAKVPEFIATIVKEMTEFQTPLRGGIRWMDMQCLNKYEKAFKDCSQQQQMELIDAIAYPKKAKPEMAQGVSFFNLMRNLTATGFYSTETGWKDIGYVGNTPNQWNGVPDDVLKQYGLAYSERELKECASYS